MAKTAASTAKTPTAGRKTATLKARTRVALTPEVSPPPVTEPSPHVDVVGQFAHRLEVLEEKITNGLVTLASELQTLKSPTPLATPEGEASANTSLPLVADIIRRSLMEHLTPLTAALKRIEERVGFIG